MPSKSPGLAAVALSVEQGTHDPKFEGLHSACACNPENNKKLISMDLAGRGSAVGRTIN